MESGILGVVTGGSFSLLLLEGLKWVIIKLSKNPGFSFSAKFYLVMIPTMNVAVTPLLALLGFKGYLMPADWVVFFQSVAQILIASFVSVGGYNVVVKPFLDKFFPKIEEIESKG